MDLQVGQVFVYRAKSESVTYRLPWAFKSRWARCWVAEFIERIQRFPVRCALWNPRESSMRPTPLSLTTDLPQNRARICSYCLRASPDRRRPGPRKDPDTRG